ncbi:ribosomal protein P0 (A0) (L10E) [Gonapodya sp. JEL0774]|nr:ribosomal protein P0 (A0) (L10E) [Gonapodya sp. JEL0774]
MSYAPPPQGQYYPPPPQQGYYPPPPGGAPPPQGYYPPPPQQYVVQQHPQPVVVVQQPVPVATRSDDDACCGGSLLLLLAGFGRGKKEAYFVKLEQLLTDYPTIFIVNVDNVGSNQMHQIRKSLRSEAVILMGKNTMIRKKLRALKEDNPDLERLLPVLKGNVGLVFTKSTDLKGVRTKITENRVRAPAKAGAIAPGSVVIPAGNTGMEPGKTSFFQALGIPTKIARGTIEIVNDVPIIKPGQKVGASEATLLNMLNISPFTYGLSVQYVYDQGAVFHPDLLDIDVTSLAEHFFTGASIVTKLSLGLGFPTTASIPHLLSAGYKNILGIALSTAISFPHADQVKEDRITNSTEAILSQGFRNLVSIALGTAYTFPLADELKKLLDDPSALAAALAVASSSAPAAAAPASAAPTKVADAPKVEEKKVEEEEEEEGDMGFGLFD